MDSVRGAISSGPGGIVFKVAVFVIIGVALYYFYQWLNGGGDLQEVVLYSSPSSGLPGKSDNYTNYKLSDSNIPVLLAGGEYSISTWIYITNWKVNQGYNKPFLSIGGGQGQFKTLIMYLGQNTPKLGIRVSDTSNGGIKITNPVEKQIRPMTATFGETPYTDPAGDFKRCDIESVDLQRWVNITVVLSGRTVDVYIDGKMSRSCVMAASYDVDGTNTVLSLGGPLGFGGIIGKTEVAGFAYSPDQVYRNYGNGPLDTSIWTKLKGYFDPSQYSLSLTVNGNTVVSAGS